MDSMLYMTQTYDPLRVVMSIAVAMLSGYAALDLADRVYAARRYQSAIWCGVGAFVMGSGIWSMHFLGMLALSLPVAMSYAVLPTILSWLMAVAASAAALYVACRPALKPSLWMTGSVLMALAIVSMHYTGMYAMTMSRGIVYSPLWVAASVIIALLGSAAALGLSFALRGARQRMHAAKKLGAAVFTGIAISGMHYTGMAAASFPVSSHGTGEAALNTGWLTLLTGSWSLMLLAAVLLASALDRRLEHRTAGLVDSLRQANAELRQRSHYDALTQLANRTLLEERLLAAIGQAEAGPGLFTVFYMDLDGFKLLNDNLGHRAGDEVLVDVANGMIEDTRDADTIARVGGDEFVLVATAVFDDADARHLAERLLSVVRRSASKAPGLSASIGWARFPEHGRDTETLVAAADRAMYHAKHHGKNACIGYHADMAEQARVEFALQHNLAAALDDDEIVIHYQPKYWASDRQLCGAEALVRWQHPQRGLISPGEFVPMAERTGQVEALETHIFEQICRQIRRWLDEGLDVPRVSVNLSATRVSDRRLPERVKKCLVRHGLAARHVMFEITESAAIRGMLDAAETIRGLSRLGVDVALDDFGTGHSSLSYLERLPIQQIKIDRSFVQMLEHSSQAAPVAIVRSLVALAHCLDMTVVAEGVETETQLAEVNELGCDEIQGFLFSQALPADDFRQLMRKTPVSSRPDAVPARRAQAPEYG